MVQLVANQIHPPKRKRALVGDVNPRKRIWYKDGSASILFCKNATTNSAKVLIESIKDNMEKLGIELHGHFLITQ